MLRDYEDKMREVQSVMDYILPFARKNGITLAIYFHATYIPIVKQMHIGSGKIILLLRMQRIILDSSTMFGR